MPRTVHVDQVRPNGAERALRQRPILRPQFAGLNGVAALGRVHRDGRIRAALAILTHRGDPQPSAGQQTFLMDWCQQPPSCEEIPWLSGFCILMWVRVLGTYVNDDRKLIGVGNRN